MARAFTTDDLIQAKDGTDLNTAAAAVNLNNPTTADTTLLAFVKGNTALFHCGGWDLIAQDGDGSNSPSGTRIFAKSPAVAGETSWSFTNPAISSAKWAWRIEEWRNCRWAGPLLTAGGVGTVAAPTTISSGTSGNPPWPFIMAIAAWSLQIGGTTGTFPGISALSNSFAEVAQVAAGSGGAPLDCKLYVARYFGAQDEAGPWSSTLTLTGSIAGSTGAGALAVIASSG